MEIEQPIIGGLLYSEVKCTTKGKAELCVILKSKCFPLQSLENEYVPLLVSLCVGVVESRGLQTQGIYRIPGNKASVTYLTEMINKDPKSIDYDDAR